MFDISLSSALRNGDSYSVTTFFFQLEFSGCGVRSRDIQAQLNREFGAGTVQNVEIVDPLYDGL